MSYFYVIAKDYTQGKTWVHNKRKTDKTFDSTYLGLTDIVIVTEPSHLAGRNIQHGILLTGWQENPYIKEILQLAVIHTAGLNTALNTAYDRVR